MTALHLTEISCSTKTWHQQIPGSTSVKHSGTLSTGDLLSPTCLYRFIYLISTFCSRLTSIQSKPKLPTSKIMLNSVRSREKKKKFKSHNDQLCQLQCHSVPGSDTEILTCEVAVSSTAGTAEAATQLPGLWLSLG